MMECISDHNNMRNDSIDIVKGIGIILIVIGHTNFKFKNWIYLFHVAVFFMASGYCYNDMHSKDCRQFIRYVISRVKKLYVPYVTCNLIFLCGNNLFVRSGLYANNEMHMLHRGGILKIIFFIGSTTFGGATWFLRILFVVSVGYCLIEMITIKIQGNNMDGRAMFICFIFSVMVICFQKYIKSSMFIQLQICSIAYIMGIIIRRITIYKETIPIHKTIVSIKGKTLPFLVLVSTFGGLCILLQVGKIEISKNIITNIPFYITSSILGWFLLLSTSELLPYKIKTFFLIVGKHTMPILLLHFISFKLVTYVYMRFSHESLRVLSEFPVVEEKGFLWILYSIIGVTVPLFADMLYRKLKNIVSGFLCLAFPFTRNIGL